VIPPVMDTLLDELNRLGSRAFLDLHMAGRRSEQASGAETLYLYTDAEGLRGILSPVAPDPDPKSSASPGAILATDYRYLEDVRERLAFGERTRAAIGKAIAEDVSPHAHPFRLMASEVKLFVQRDLGFATCFYEEGDLASLWRAYGKGGGGYALGFARTDLSHLPWSLFGPWDSPTLRVSYRQEDLDQAMAGLIGSVAGLFAGIEGRDRRSVGTNQDERTLVAELAWHLNALTVFFGNPAHADEKEWRAVFRRSVPTAQYVSFRLSKGLLTPHLLVPLTATDEHGHDYPVRARRIVCGPTVDSRRKEYGLNLFLEYLDSPTVEGCEVTSSRAGVHR
jgi:hypothetical protein